LLIKGSFIVFLAKNNVFEFVKLTNKIPEAVGYFQFAENPELKWIYHLNSKPLRKSLKTILFHRLNNLQTINKNSISPKNKLFKLSLIPKITQILLVLYAKTTIRRSLNVKIQINSGVFCLV
jgi:hypothetical protein